MGGDGRPLFSLRPGNLWTCKMKTAAIAGNAVFIARNVLHRTSESVWNWNLVSLNVFEGKQQSNSSHGGSLLNDTWEDYHDQTNFKIKWGFKFLMKMFSKLSNLKSNQRIKYLFTVGSQMDSRVLFFNAHERFLQALKSLASQYAKRLLRTHCLPPFPSTLQCKIRLQRRKSPIVNLKSHLAPKEKFHKY